MFMLTKKMIVKGHFPKARLVKFSLLIEIAENCAEESISVNSNKLNHL